MKAYQSAHSEKKAALQKIQALEASAQERALKKIINCSQQFALKLVVHPELDHYLNVIDKAYLNKLAEEMNAHLEFAADDNMHINDYHFFSSTSNKRIEV